MVTRLREFRAEAKKQMVLRDWKHKDLAKATGYSVSTIDCFMSGHYAKASDDFVRTVAKALDIPEHMAT